MEQTVVTATSGRAQGTRPSRRLRAEGQLPAVVYGLGKDPIPVAVSYTDLRDALKGEAGMNTVINLDVDGKETETVIVRSVQRHPIRRVVTHADFLRIDPNQQVSVKVPIRMVGEANEVAENGGLIEQKMFEIEVLVSPLDIPAEIEADISQMDMDTRVSVGDLALPGGVTTTVAEDISVVIPVASRASKMAEDEDIEDGAEATDAGGDDAADAEGGEE
ncbi:MAG: 50S ribosomal protein L25 [Actinomycetota bacterium]